MINLYVDEQTVILIFVNCGHLINCIYQLQMYLFYVQLISHNCDIIIIIILF